jgi:hypothetical protein
MVAVALEDVVTVTLAEGDVVTLTDMEPLADTVFVMDPLGEEDGEGLREPVVLVVRVTLFVIVLVSLEEGETVLVGLPDMVAVTETEIEPLPVEDVLLDGEGDILGDGDMLEEGDGVGRGMAIVKFAPSSDKSEPSALEAFSRT